MSPKHTAGPWRLHDMERFTVVAGTPGTSYSVADCHSRNLSDEERESNARLIAAAPELLDALELVVEEFRPKECNCDGEYTQDGLVGQACYFHRIEASVKLAIAKAEGKS